MRLSIRARLLLYSLLLLLTSINLIAGIALYLHIDSLEEQHRHFGEELAEVIGHNIIDPLHNLEIHKLNQQLAALNATGDIPRTLILDQQGIILADGTPENLLLEEPFKPLTPILKELNEGVEDLIIWEHEERIAITHSIITPFNEFLGYIHLELSREDIDEAVTMVIQQFILAEIVLLIFSTLAALLLANFFHRPLQEAVTTADAIAAGNYSIPDSQRHDEFGDLSRSLQQMAQQIEETINTLNGTQLELEEIFRSMTDGILLVNNQGTILKINQRLETLCQSDSQALTGLSLDDLFGETVKLSDFYGEGVEKQLVLSNDEIPVHVSGALIHPPHLDRAIGSVLVIHDLRDRIRAERQEQYAAFQAGIAEMGASVLHNIGNVITGMIGHIMKLQSRMRTLEKLLPALDQYADESTRIAEEQSDTEAVKGRLLETAKVLKGSVDSFTRIQQQFESLDKLESGVRHIGDIISIQQSASRPQLSASQFTLKQLIEDTYSLIDERISKYNICWNLQLSPEINSVTLPRNPLMQLLLNLIKNSLEAIISEMVDNSTLEGSITLSTQSLENGQFILSLQDNGCGIAAEQLNHIFSPHHTTKSGGSGYGLHSAINFVRQIDGEIRAESDGPHTGTTIILTLPRKLSTQEPDDETEPTPLKR